MTRLIYVKGDDINEFIRAADRRLVEYEYVILRIEPGDATRYDLIITALPNDFLISLVNLNRYTVLVGRMVDYVEPGWLDWPKEINVCTDGLVCEVYNSIRAGKALGKFFDWEVGHYMG
ncbi:hypothetical protein HN803_04660 [candidate division WWE3 bacterium]|jgi:hypothetical protein|nr:hypothetical protein [Candidatus Scalindua sp.]MBT7350055.1 hypothetical protein [candidate division WWE3 bacterium]